MPIRGKAAPSVRSLWDVLTLDEAAVEAGLSRETLRRHSQAGLLQTHTGGGRGHRWLITRAALNEFLESERRPRRGRQAVKPDIQASNREGWLLLAAESELLWLAHAEWTADAMRRFADRFNRIELPAYTAWATSHATGAMPDMPGLRGLAAIAAQLRPWNVKGPMMPPPRPPGKLPENFLEILEAHRLHLGGLPFRMIAERLGIDERTARRHETTWQRLYGPTPDLREHIARREQATREARDLESAFERITSEAPIRITHEIPDFRTGGEDQ